MGLGKGKGGGDREIAGEEVRLGVVWRGAGCRRGSAL